MASSTSINSLRETMVEAGVEVLERDQFRLVADSISYAKVFAYLETEYSVRVTRASVHERIWKSHDHFRREVIQRALEHFPTVLPDERIAGVFDSVIGAALESPALSDRIDFFVRLVGTATLQAVLDSPARRHLQAAKAVCSNFNDPEIEETFQDLLNGHLNSVAAEARTLFAGLSARLGGVPDTSCGLEAEEIAHVVESIRGVLDCGEFLNCHAGSTEPAEPVSFRGLSAETPGAWFPVSIAQSMVFRYFYREAEGKPEPLSGQGRTWPEDPEATGLPDPKVVEATDRRPREELRDLVLAAGVELLLGSAAELRPEAVTYASVFKYLKDRDGMVVHRASVHKRIWQSQEDFVLEVLDRALKKSMGSAVSDFEIPMPQPVVKPDGSVDRQQTVRDRIRSMADSRAATFAESDEHKRLVLAKAAMFGKANTPGVNSIQETIKALDDDFVERCKALAAKALVDVGFEVRPELMIDRDEALHIFALIVLTLTNGVMFDGLAGVDASKKRYTLLRVDQSDKSDSWGLVALTAWICFDHLFIETEEP